MQWSLILLFLMGQFCFMDCQLYEYHYISENKTWTEAQQYCREKHTDLVTVTNMKDMKDLERFIKISDRDWRGAWIGLYDPIDSNRTWRWSLPGVEFSQSETNWDTEEPNNANGMQNCGIIRKSLKWDHISCNTAKDFLCYDDRNSSKKFHLIQENKTWMEAQSYCRENHTDLISGTKQLQDEEVKNEISPLENNTYIYTGLFRDTWRWSDGSSSSFRHWVKGFDNDAGYDGHCVRIVFDEGGRWRSENCAETKPFICYDGKVILIKENKTWHEAWTHCRDHHHNLVTITNTDNKRWIQEKVKNASTDYVWMGLRLNCSSNVWFWVCDNWTWNEQNDCNKFGAMEAGGEYQWFQRNGSERFNFICTKY